MDKERFDFLTYEQFERLSQEEKVAYLERATVELERLRTAHIGALEHPEPNSRAIVARRRKKQRRALPLTGCP